MESKVAIVRYVSLVFVCFCCVASSYGQKREGSAAARTINQRITPVWSDSTHFTYSEQTADGSVKRHAIDAVSGKRVTVDKDSISNAEAGLRGGPFPRSQSSASETYQEFVNETEKRVRLYWIDMQGNPVGYARLKPGDSYSQHTYAGHAWMVKADDGTFFGSLIAQSPARVARINQTFDLPKRPRRRDRSERSARQDSNLSPDGRCEFRRSETGIQLRQLSTEAVKWVDLDVGETTDQEVVSPAWSPDGTVLVAWKVARHQPADAVTIESSPRGGGRAIVKTHPYRLPGDPSDEYKLIAFEARTGNRIDVELPVIDFGRPRLRWLGEHHLVIEKVDRGHQRVRLFVVDPLQGKSHAVVDESSSTFIWTAHGPHVPLFTYLEDADQVLYASEISGYRHLYLVKLDDRNTQPGRWRENAITTGDWLVREIVHIDEQSRTIDLMVGEFYDDQDPYHRHLVRVGIDDGKLTAVTKSNGDHTVQFSPDRQYAIATSSRVDSPPVHELRRMSDGKLITELMRATRIGKDLSPWSLPKVFQAPGRDGETQIWGNLYFPEDFDASLRDQYPVIEAIYAGPHDSHVPKRYLNSSRFRELTSLGFVVVQIDGMGTANRSKAFHDQCWHNLKDAGFPDRIAWLKAAAEAYPAIDLSRVGIFGTSAGGQNACGALLFHGDFYKAAYASCGCHDNRMDKASWNEQWMGYPVGDHYAKNSNIDNASQLTGDLFLVVGELDTNVPPESTHRLVNALVKANKDFEFLMIPGMGHSDGGSYGRRKMREFFVEKLRPAER